MVTILLILLAVLFVAGIVATVHGMARGCPFAWLSVMFGGLGNLFEGLFAVLGELTGNE